MFFILSVLAIIIFIYFGYAIYSGIKYGALFLPEQILSITKKYADHSAVCDGISYFSSNCTRLLTVEYVTSEYMNIYICNMSKELREFVLRDIEGIEEDVDTNVRSRISHQSYLKIIERLCKYFEDTKYPLRIKYLSSLIPE